MKIKKKINLKKKKKKIDSKKIFLYHSKFSPHFWKTADEAVK